MHSWVRGGDPGLVDPRESAMPRSDCHLGGAWLLLGLCHISTYTKKLLGVGSPIALAALSLSPLPACVVFLCLLSLKMAIL